MELENKLFDLQNCIKGALDIFHFKAAEAGLQLAYHIEADVPKEITGDSLRLRQVLINLIGNAIKFTPAGEVCIAVHLLKQTDTSITQINFEVRDTGIGIAADKIDRLFKAFSQVDSSTTRKHGGTGLGLVICEKLVELMGGSINVISTPGKGTTFTFCIRTSNESRNISSGINVNLPAKTTASFIPGQSDDQPLSADFSIQFPLRILIAEDNAINRLIANKILNKLGYKPATAENGTEVLKMLDEQQFDLVLMDVQMPEMDGLEATRAIRMNNKGQQPTIIAMTANAMQGDKEECLAAGMDDYLGKPINLNELVDMLKKWGQLVQLPKEKV